jgi:hypothetical protein
MSDKTMPSEPDIMEPTLWRRNGWTARVIKNEDDDGWAVAAFLLAGEMAVAYFQFHAPQGFWPTMNGGVAAVLYCFIWLYFSAAGAGPWSLDSRRGK